MGMTHDEKLRKRVFQRQATDFMVWRAGKALDWKCTATELAEESGINKATVHLVLNRRGWRNRITQAPSVGRPGRYDLVEIMTRQATNGDFSLMRES